MSDADLQVRLAAFAQLDVQVRTSGEVLERQFLSQGFTFEGERVPFLGPQGIFKPRLCRLSDEVDRLDAYGRWLLTPKSCARSRQAD